MARRGTLYELIKSKNPELAKSIRKVSGAFRSPLSGSRHPPEPAKSEVSGSRALPPIADSLSGEHVELRERQAQSLFNTHTQPKTPSRTERQIVDAHIGLDFGTSCSKVVISLPHERRTFAVHFGQYGHSSNPYLLPSIISFSPDRVFSLKPSSQANNLQNLKMGILRAGQLEGPALEKLHGSVSPEMAGAAYLVEVLRLTQLWFEQNYGNTYGKHNIRWWCNLGVPAKSYADDVVCERFGRVALTAWALLGSPRTLDAATVADTLARCHDWRQTTDLNSDARIQIVPEVLAAVASYIKSGTQKDGPHILMDVGAGTLDTCSFRITEKLGDSTCAILGANVALLGVLALEHCRIAAVLQSMKRCVKSHGFARDPVLPIRLNTEDYIPTADQLAEIHADISSAEMSFESECGAAVQEIWKALRSNRDPLYLNEIPFVLSGGGSGLPTYRHFPTRIWMNMQATTIHGQLRPLLLQLPNLSAPALPNEQLHRFSVATGLSYPRLELGEILRPQDVPDIPGPEPSDPDRGERFISKDQV